MGMGERILQKRREKGLSQEGLGELLGVSRQAIYKWENDSALPEVEKLVQLAQHFGVSVGWLLGVEEEKAELNGQQLAMVEQIVQRYLAARPRLSRRWRRGLFAAAAMLLIAGLALFARLEGLDRRYDALQSAVDGIADEQNRLSRYGAELTELDHEAGVARFSLFAVPEQYETGMQAEFVAQSGGETVKNLVAWPEQPDKYVCELTCPLSDDMRLSVTFLAPGGARETRLLEIFTGCLSRSYPVLRIDDYRLADLYMEEGKLMARDFYISTKQLSSGSHGAEAVSLRVGLFRNQTLLGWAEPCEKPADFHGFAEEQFYRMEDMALALGEEDRLQVAALVTDSHGRNYMDCGKNYALERQQWSDTLVLPQLVHTGGACDRDPAKWDFTANGMTP